MHVTADPLAALLKDRTSDLHTRAERHPLQRALVSGRIARVGYAAYLGQMLCIHRALDRALRAASGGPLSPLVREYHFREDQLRADLEFLGGGETDPVPSAAAFAACIAAACPASLVGVLYVLEGSTNGGRYIARALRCSLGLEAGGAAYLDPHGERQTERWARFKADLDALDLNEGERDTAVAAAQRTFEAIIAVSDELAWDDPRSSLPASASRASPAEAAGRGGADARIGEVSGWSAPPPEATMTRQAPEPRPCTS